jgi:integrase/recombinase XerD
MEQKMAQARTLSEEEIKMVLNYCRARRHCVRDRTILQLSFLAGLRVIDIAGLKIADVYEDTGKIRDSFVLAAEQTKGGFERRVFVGRKLNKALADYYPVIRKRKPDTPLFQTQIGGAFSANTMCQLFLNIYSAAGLKGASSHSGRRTFITKLANSGVNVRVLAALAGHRSIVTTQRYIDVNEVQLARAVELV